jgi:hypothetical protein
MIRVIKLRDVRWLRNVTLMEDMRNIYKVFTGKPKRKTSFRDRGVDAVKINVEGTG